MSWLLLLAEAGQEGAAPPLLANPLFMLVIMVLIMYFFMIAPMKKQRREQQSMLTQLKANDKVVTSAGILGVVMSVKEGEDEVMIRSAETKLRVLKSSIIRVASSIEDGKAGDAKQA